LLPLTIAGTVLGIALVNTFKQRDGWSSPATWGS